MNTLSRGALYFGCIWTLASCATPPEPTEPSHIAPPPEIAAQVPRKLPRSAHVTVVPYPDKAWDQGLTGRVLVEFRIDSRGKVVSAWVVGADAAPVLQEGALATLGGYTFDTSPPGFKQEDPRPFFVTVRFCLPKCGDIADYPGTEDVRVWSERGSGSPPKWPYKPND